jgi:hypothetical protein
MTRTSRKKPGLVVIAVGVALFAWFVFEFFREDWDGTGNPMWLAFMGALVLNDLGRRLLRDHRPSRRR